MTDEERRNAIKAFLDTSVDFVLTEDDIDITKKLMVIQSWLLQEIYEKLECIDISLVAIHANSDDEWNTRHNK